MGGWVGGRVGGWVGGRVGGWGVAALVARPSLGWWHPERLLLASTAASRLCSRPFAHQPTAQSHTQSNCLRAALPPHGQALPLPLPPPRTCALSLAMRAAAGAPPSPGQATRMPLAASAAPAPAALPGDPSCTLRSARAAATAASAASAAGAGAGGRSVSVGGSVAGWAGAMVRARVGGPPVAPLQAPYGRAPPKGATTAHAGGKHAASPTPAHTPRNAAAPLPPPAPPSPSLGQDPPPPPHTHTTTTTTTTTMHRPVGE